MSRPSKKVKSVKYSLQGGRCHWCNKVMLLSFDHADQSNPLLATFEHLDDAASGKPRTNRQDRVVLACYKCNHERGISTSNYLNYLKSLDNEEK